MVHYDPSDPRWSTNPGPLFDEIREAAPVHFTPGGYWVVARHADCLALLRSRDASADSLNLLEGKRPKLRGTRRDNQLEEIRATGNDTRPFLFRDPPDHTRLRGLVQRAFTPKRVNELTSFIERQARQVIERHLSNGPFDAVEELAWSLPVSVICEMLAIPREDHQKFQAQSAMLARGLDPDFLLNDDDRAARDAAILYFGVYFHELFAERRRQPGGDLLSALIAARDSEDQLSEGELLSTAILIAVAGHETTMNLISGSLLLLAQNEAAQRELRSDPSIDRMVTEEMLRMVSPVQLTGRSMLNDVEIDGHVLEKGSFVFILLGAANRDPGVFARPTELNVRRELNPHLGFGFGLHHCLGAPLARLESSVAIRELLNVTRSITLHDEELRYRPNIVLRGLESLMVSIKS
jgi:cytochrome P450